MRIWLPKLMSRLVSSSLRVAAWRFSISSFVQPRAKQLHGQFAILVLAALVLALHDDARRQVRDAHRGFHFVHILPARAARAKRVHAHFLGPNVDFDAVVNFGNHEDRSERRVAPRRLIERRNADQAMHAAFGGEQAVGVFAFDAHRGRFDAPRLRRAASP